MNDRQFARAHDAYLDPDRYFGGRGDSERDRHCSKCGGFLAERPDRTVDWEESDACDGSAVTVSQEYSEGLVAVLGDEYRGQTYDLLVSACGVDVGPHEPHLEVLAAGVTEHRTCARCGHDNEEVLA